MKTSWNARNARTTRLALALLCMGLAGAAHSQATGDDAAVRRLEDQERSAVLAGDVGTLTNIWSERMMVNSPLGRVSENRAETLRLVQAGVIRYTSFERSIESLRVSGDLAVVMGAETVVPTGSAPGAGQQIKRRFTNIWQRDGATWRMVARHANNVAEGAPR